MFLDKVVDMPVGVSGKLWFIRSCSSSTRSWRRGLISCGVDSVQRYRAGGRVHRDTASIIRCIYWRAWGSGGTRASSHPSAPLLPPLLPSAAPLLPTTTTTTTWEGDNLNVVKSHFVWGVAWMADVACPIVCRPVWPACWVDTPDRSSSSSTRVVQDVWDVKRDELGVVPDEVVLALRDAASGSSVDDFWSIWSRSAELGLFRAYSQSWRSP